MGVVLVSLVVYLAVALVLSLTRSRLFFDPHTRMPYAFGISNPKTRPYSLQVVLALVAVTVYFVTAFVGLRFARVCPDDVPCARAPLAYAVPSYTDKSYADNSYADPGGTPPTYLAGAR